MGRLDFIREHSRLAGLISTEFQVVEAVPGWGAARERIDRKDTSKTTDVFAFLAFFRGCRCGEGRADSFFSGPLLPGTIANLVRRDILA